MKDIFCRIIDGEIPCVKVYEDDDVLAILDISQTILADIFDMVLICDMEKAKGSLKEVQDELGALGKELGVDVRAQLADIFYAMHRI